MKTWNLRWKTDTLEGGTVLRVLKDFEPFSIEHNHWDGWHFECEEECAWLASAAPAMQTVLRDLQEVLGRFNNREDGAEDDLLYYYTKIIPNVLALSEGKEIT